MPFMSNMPSNHAVQASRRRTQCSRNQQSGETTTLLVAGEQQQHAQKRRLPLATNPALPRVHGLPAPTCIHAARRARMTVRGSVHQCNLYENRAHLRSNARKRLRGSIVAKVGQQWRARCGARTSSGKKLQPVHARRCGRISCPGLQIRLQTQTRQTSLLPPRHTRTHTQRLPKVPQHPTTGGDQLPIPSILRQAFLGEAASAVVV